MTVPALLLHTALSLAAGGAIAGLIGLPLRFEERVLTAIVVAIAAPAMVAYLVAAQFGLSPATVLAGPVLVVIAAGVAVLLGAANPRATWVTSWRECVSRWRAHPRIGFSLFAVGSMVFFGLIFARSLVMDSTGSLMAGYQTVWADWSQHLTTEASFAVAHNVPPMNPLFSGTPLLYPFMPDFHSAELMVLGMGPEQALAIPGAVLGVTISLLLVCVAERLGARAAAGGIAAVVAVLGGGLGFLRSIGDACIAAVAPSAASATPGGAYDLTSASTYGCTLHQIAHSPGVWPAVLHNVLFTTIWNQPRAYDGLLTDPAQLPVHNLQWPTPLMGWWLPQRSFVYGCAIVAAVILVIAALIEEKKNDPWAWGIAGALAGMLPLFHVHSLIALAVIMVVVAIRHSGRWREWAIFVAVAAVVAGPRLIQLSLSPHGSIADGDAYPQLIPGWAYQFDPANPDHQGLVTYDGVSLGNALRSAGAAVSLPFQANWWEFWMVNLGVAVPLSAFVALAAVARLAPGRTRAVATTMLRPFPSALMPWALGAVLLFAVANVVVFQTWWWDNTKVFAYWYIVVGLLIGCLVTHWWRSAELGTIAVVLLGMSIASGVLVVVRLTPWENRTSRDVVAGPWAIDTASDVLIGHEVAARTPDAAVFITSTRPQDPIQTISGRTTVEGYFGWLWSYGTVFGPRGHAGGEGDLETMVRGCQATPIESPSCPVARLLHQYGVSFVEIDTRGDTNGITDADPSWWSAQGLPVTARDSEMTVYDVRHV